MSRAALARGVAAAVLLGALVLWRQAEAPFAPVAQPAAGPDPSIIFAGDIMLDRNVAVHAREAGTSTLFAGVAGYLKAADARVINLEGAITTNPSIAQVDHTVLHFTFDPGLAEAVLRPLDLAAASLANNHAYDWGRAGYDATRAYLQSWGIAPFGHPYNARDLSTAIDVRGKRFCLVGYHSLYDPATAEAVSEIARLRSACDRVIVFAHWGEEYAPAADAQQVAAAHQFIDSGADLVIGAHPHVVQNVEVYNGHAIFYSLGNFMFDQDFSWATTHGLMVKATFGASSITFELAPVTVKGQEASLSDEADSERVLEAAGSLARWSLP